MKNDHLIKDILVMFRQTISALIGWLFGYPLSFFIQRDSKLTIVVGRRGSVFADNTKYFFIYARKALHKNEQIIFLSNDASIVDKIQSAGGRACRHPSLKSLLLVLRCGRIVVDMADWFDFGVYPMSHGALRIQLWHGAPLKYIELDLFTKRIKQQQFWAKVLLIMQKAILGRYPVYDVVLATSQKFVDQVFSRSFKAKKFLTTGYPRNDVLFTPLTDDRSVEPLIWINVDRKSIEAVNVAHRLGQKVALYTPTFRQDLESPFEKIIALSRLSAFAKQHQLVVAIKLHPFIHNRISLRQFPNIIECAPLSDIYPLMALCDILITDYSSIYLDFLLLDRPIIFFIHDLSNYIEHDRSLYFPYHTMTPGHKCYTQEELECALSDILSPLYDDEYANHRYEVCRITHKNMNPGAVYRLLNSIVFSNRLNS